MSLGAASLGGNRASVLGEDLAYQESRLSREQRDNTSTKSRARSGKTPNKTDEARKTLINLRFSGVKYLHRAALKQRATDPKPQDPCETKTRRCP